MLPQDTYSCGRETSINNSDKSLVMEEKASNDNTYVDFPQNEGGRGSQPLCGRLSQTEFKSMFLKFYTSGIK